jgi:membrane protein required for colicin V production
MNLHWFDILVIIFGGFGLIRGWFKGFIIEISSLVAIFLASLGAVHFSELLSQKLINEYGFETPLLPYFSFGFTFIVILILVFVGAKLLEKVIKIAMLGIFNRIAGALFGMFKSFLIIGFFVFIAQSIGEELKLNLEKEDEESIFQQSVSFPYFEEGIRTILPTLQNLDFETIKNSIDTKMEDLKEGIEV